MVPAGARRTVRVLRASRLWRVGDRVVLVGLASRAVRAGDEWKNGPTGAEWVRTGQRRSRGIVPSGSKYQETTRGFMSKPSSLILIAALAGSGVSNGQPVRRYDDTGAPPFKVLK